MSFGPARSLITAILLSSLLAPAGLSSRGDFDSEVIPSETRAKRFLSSTQASILSYLPLAKKICRAGDEAIGSAFASSSLKLHEIKITKSASSSPQVKKSSTRNKTKILSPAKNQVSISPKQRTIDSYWKSSSDEASFSTSSSQETLTIDENDKENTPPVSSQLSIEEKKKQQTNFMNLFRQLPAVDYNAIKEGLLKKSWPISKHGNPYINISSSDSPDRRSHHIIITQSPSCNGKIEYSAYIDGKPYTDFIKHKPLGHAWFPDHDSIKRAAITIIYK